MLSNFLKYALSAHLLVKGIDTALGKGDFAKLTQFSNTQNYQKLLSNEVETSYEQGPSDSGTTVSKLRQPNLETQLMIDYAGTLVKVEKLTEDFAEHACVSCERLCLRKNVSRIELSEAEFDSDVWLSLLAYLICTNPEANSEELYICNYCKPKIRCNDLPNRCVLNGLITSTCSTRVGGARRTL